MEELIKEFFKDSNGNLSSTQQFAAKSLPFLFTVLIALIAVHFIANLAKKLIKKSRLPKSMHPFVVSGIKFVLDFLIIISACSKIGIDVTSLVAAFSVVGVAVSLSIQNTLANVMAGFSLLFTKQFEVDDYIEAGGVSGTVMRIGLASCKLKTYDGKDIYVPNSSIVSANITNYSREPIRRVDVTIGTSYSESVDKVKASLRKVVDDTPEIIKDKDIFIGITNFGASSIDYTIRVWVKNADYWNTYLPMLERIKRTFEEDHIEIPFNQLDVHLKKD
ncbi:MAG: mechanosensitive ion channel [Clostridia bacterium]|nr:mechanosensitive ion channel [Clostridia bacterium]